MSNISIAMCTYNGEKFLLDQIDSLNKQSLRPLELVVCDDLSSDKTLEILESFSRKCAFPVKIHQNAERLGYVKNFMKAASLCEGELIAFCDQDDVWNTEKLKVIQRSFDDPDVLMVHHNARLIDADGTPFARLNEEDFFSSISNPGEENPWRFPLGFTETFRNSLLPFSEYRMQYMGESPSDWAAHDQWYFFLASTLGKVIYIDDDLADYRQHNNNTFGARRRLDRNSIFYKIDGKIKAYRDYTALERVCRNRIIVIGAMQKNFDSDDIFYKNACISADFFRALSTLYSERAQTYSARSIFERARHWITLVNNGGYSRKRRYHFSSISLIRDLIQGVLLSKLNHKENVDTADFSLKINLSAAK